MRLFPPAAALALIVSLGLAAGAFAATPDLPAAAPAAAAPPALAQEPDTPPPFVLRPKRQPQPARPDVTYASRPAPASFRGLAWGASLSEAEANLGLAPVADPRPLPGAYQRPGELLKIGQADVRTVAYYFRKGVFIGAGVMFEGEANFFLIKDHLMELYGPGRQVGDRYGWTWDTLSVDLRLRDGVGELRYTYEAPTKK